MGGEVTVLLAFVTTLPATITAVATLIYVVKLRSECATSHAQSERGRIHIIEQLDELKK